MLLIFDWDGTLIDSTEKIISCMQQAGTTAGLPSLSEQQIKGIIGLGLPEAIQTLYPEADAESRERFREHYARHYLEADREPCDFFPGVMETLEQFKSAGHTLTIATGKSRRGLDRILNNMKLMDFFHGSRCSDETRSKPHPQMLRELLKQFSHQPQNALMVGDTTFDMQMAMDAGIPRIGVSYGVHAVEALMKFEPKAVIDRFGELQNYL